MDAGWLSFAITFLVFTRSLCLSPKEDLIVALTSDLLLYSFPLKKKEKDSAQKRNSFTTFLHPFHSGPIEGLDICHRFDQLFPDHQISIIGCRKPLIVTCSKDQTIRVWNYLTKGMELAKKFREELFRYFSTFTLITFNTRCNSSPR